MLTNLGKEVFKRDMREWWPEKIGEGVYESSCFNLASTFTHPLNYEQLYPQFEGTDFDCYGVCDTPEQLIEQYGELLERDHRHLVILLARILRAEQPAEGGWRWHRWGRYIGIQDPQCVYIHDEPLIERVYVYQVLDIGPANYELSLQGSL